MIDKTKQDRLVECCGWRWRPSATYDYVDGCHYVYWLKLALNLVFKDMVRNDPHVQLEISCDSSSTHSGCASCEVSGSQAPRAKSCLSHEPSPAAGLALFGWFSTSQVPQQCLHLAVWHNKVYIKVNHLVVSQDINSFRPFSEFQYFSWNSFFANLQRHKALYVHPYHTLAKRLQSCAKSLEFCDQQRIFARQSLMCALVQNRWKLIIKFSEYLRV